MPKKCVDEDVITCSRTETDHITGLVDPLAYCVTAADCPQVRYFSALPYKRVRSLISRKTASPSYLTPIVNGSCATEIATKSAQVAHLAFRPEEGMNRNNSVRVRD